MSKTEKEPKVTVIRLGAYDLDKYIPDSGSEKMRNKDPLDEVIEARKRMLAERAKELQAQVYIKQLEREVDEAGGGEAGTASQQSEALVSNLLLNPEVQKQWLSYTDEQRTVLLTVINSTVSARGGKAAGSDINSVLPLLFMRMNQNPTSNVKDLIELVNLVTGGQRKDDEGKSLIEAMRLGFEMAKSSQPQGGSREGILKEAMEFLKPLYETLAGKDKELYNQQFEFLKGQIASPADIIKSLTENAQALGFQRGNTSLEIEKFKVDHDRWKTEQEWGQERWREEMALKKVNEQQRWQAIQDLGSKFIDRAGPVIDATIRRSTNMIQGPTAPQQAQEGATAQEAPQPTVHTFPCQKCKEPVQVTGPPFPSTVTCEKCGEIHDLKAGN